MNNFVKYFRELWHTDADMASIYLCLLVFTSLCDPLLFCVGGTCGSLLTNLCCSKGAVTGCCLSDGQQPVVK